MNAKCPPFCQKLREEGMGFKNNSRDLLFFVRKLLFSHSHLFLIILKWIFFVLGKVVKKSLLPFFHCLERLVKAFDKKVYKFLPKCVFIQTKIFVSSWILTQNRKLNFVLSSSFTMKITKKRKFSTIFSDYLLPKSMSILQETQKLLKLFLQTFKELCKWPFVNSVITKKKRKTHFSWCIGINKGKQVNSWWRYYLFSCCKCVSALSPRKL